MIHKRKLLQIITLILVLFVITTSYLSFITVPKTLVKHDSIQQLILKYTNKLNDNYIDDIIIRDELVDNFVQNIRNYNVKNLSELWHVTNSWVSSTEIIDFKSPAVGQLYHALQNAKIIKADLDSRGTQLKLLLTLEGYQNVIFKPKWYEENKVLSGPVYGGKDRYFGEIIAFYLSVILHKPFVPFSTRRTISITNEIIPVATKILKKTSYQRDNKTCIYGNCFFCTKKDPICGSVDNTIIGTVIFNLKHNFKNYRSPWRRTYKDNVKALWQENQNYCKMVKEKIPRRRLLDLIDTAILDFLIQNGDRHHYEILFNNIILVDNGKSFGNPYEFYLDVLAPLYQCCQLRTKTNDILESLRGGNLRRRLLMMPDIEVLLTEDHLKAMEQRLLIIFATIEYCKNRNKNHDWNDAVEVETTF